MSDVSVIGLGQMGSKLVELLRANGRTVTVWNRSGAKADKLRAEGVVVAQTAAEAMAASPVALVILADVDAVGEVLWCVTEGLDGCIMINLGTTGPEMARAFSSRIGEAGGTYLDGAIQAAPSQMGEASTPILLSGNRKAFEAAEPVLRLLAGNLVYLGEAQDAAAFMDLATLSYVYGAYAGFLHGVRIAEANGVDAAVFGKLVESISPSFGSFFAHQGQVIASGDYQISESPMRISITAVDRIVRTSADLGINRELPDLVNGWLANAEASGLADQELAALIKVLRQEIRSQH
jgi:3-hydroxyisobutyrate dehydrogenase-like beta-hydroxyacid dehydrogenase